VIFLRLLLSILVACVLSQAVVLVVAGLATSALHGRIDGLFAILALPMTLAFFGIPALLWSLFVIFPTYAVFWWYGRAELASFVVFALGAAILAYHAIARPAPTGAMPGYDQTAQVFVAFAFIGWAVLAYFRPELRRAK
jgi:hypothetical protein